MATVRPPAPRPSLTVSLSQALMSGKKLPIQTEARRFQETSSVSVVFSAGSAYSASRSSSRTGSPASPRLVEMNASGSGLADSSSGK